MFVLVVNPLETIFWLFRNVKGSQEVVDFVGDRLREQRKNSQLNLTKICEEVNMHCQFSLVADILWARHMGKEDCVKSPKERLFF